MNKIKTIFEDYLNQIGQLQEEKLGPKESKKVTKADNDHFHELVRKQLLFNNKIIIITVILLCILFFTGIFFVFYFRDSPETIAFIFGGTFLSLLIIVAWLRKLWIEKNLLDVSLRVTEGLSPAEAARFIENIYWKILIKSDSKLIPEIKN